MKLIHNKEGDKLGLACQKVLNFVKGWCDKIVDIDYPYYKGDDRVSIIIGPG